MGSVKYKKVTNCHALPLKPYWGYDKIIGKNTGKEAAH